ncbi:MAG TPA: aspartate/glutamate racemase family protein, partial [Candidatus Deferrimicrobium sp.]|nr:aspartate/glutamate racemase family protein [Candidatus Deferrimicrobium sp.]
PMLERIKRRGHEDPADDEHLLDHVRVAEAIGAAALLVTCSSVSRAVGRVRDRAAIPLVAIDDSMAAEAVRIGGRVTVVATAATTLDPSRELLEATAERAGVERAGRPISVSLRMVEGALPALLAGDAALHDHLVVRTLREAAPESDVIVLAQATMARVLPALADAPLPIPVLTSPQLALAAVRAAIAVPI